MKQPISNRKDKVSSALVITLLGVVLLTIIVVAFMQTMSLSLTTSKSYVDIRRANFAAQAGLDTAIAQISAAAGTNLAFVTGLTNYVSGSKNFPVTLIGEGNLTNFDQIMPLVSGNIGYLTNFGVAGFANNFNAYTAPIVSGAAGQTIDLNTSPYEFIEWTNGIASGVNIYNASWVTLTNTVGSQTSYTRYAYIVLDDAARVNPGLMSGSGTGYSNPTNWYTGPQDINATTMTNVQGGQIVSSSALARITNSAISSSFGYSDATFGEAYSSASYASNRIFITSRMNPTYDVIPAWYPSGGMPKYNINDLATNTAYGTSGLARATYIAGIITNNLPNFYTRDPALTGFGDKTLYVNRLAANIVDYINPDYPNNVFYNTDYTYSTNNTGVSPQGNGIYPILIFEQLRMASGGAGDGTGTKYTTAKVVTTFWLSCWNPFTTPVKVQTASLHVSSRPGYTLSTGPSTPIPDYISPLYVISGYNGTQVNSLPYTVQPNEFVVLGFVPQTNTITTTGASTSSAPVGSANETNNYIPNQVPSTLEQYALNVNGQTTAQSGGNASFNGPGMSGGLSYFAQNSLSTSSIWIDDAIEIYGSEVADPRMASYFNNGWFSKGSQSDSYATSSYWKGASGGGGSRTWSLIFPSPGPSGSTATPLPVTVSLWGNRDNIARSPASVGSVSASQNTTPDTLPSMYNLNDSNNAPNVIRNGPMVSIGELGHVFDPASANDALTSASPRTDNSGFTNNFTTGGARSLRIGRPEENGLPTTFPTGAGSAASSTWDTNGVRAINLLDLFTVNNANINASGTNSIAQSMNSGGVLGRINVNTASSNVLTSVLSGIAITSDPTMTNSSGTVIHPVLNNIPAMVNQLMTNRPYSSLSDLYKTMPMFDTNVNYSPALPLTAYYQFNDGNYATTTPNDPYLLYPVTMNVFNRVHQEAFGKLVQHLTVQSRSYRIYVIGQVLDSSQNPHGSVAMEAGIYLQYNPNSTPPKYVPTIQYLRVLK